MVSYIPTIQTNKSKSCEALNVTDPLGTSLDGSNQDGYHRWWYPEAFRMRMRMIEWNHICSHSCICPVRIRCHCTCVFLKTIGIYNLLTVSDCTLQAPLQFGRETRLKQCQHRFQEHLGDGFQVLQPSFPESGQWKINMGVDNPKTDIKNSLTFKVSWTSSQREHGSNLQMG